MSDKQEITKETLQELFVEKKFSPDKIGYMFGVTGQTIRNHLKKHGFQLGKRGCGKEKWSKSMRYYCQQMYPKRRRNSNG